MPLCVDLDGTLLTTDALHEGMVALLFRQPLALAAALPTLRHGRAALKRRIAAVTPLPASSLPVNERFLDWLVAEREAGRSLHLVTAADQAVADAVAEHLGIFESAVGSDGINNLRDAGKAALLQRRFPDGFIYAGDSPRDLEVFAASRAIVLVNADRRVTRAAMALGKPILAEFPRRPAGAGDWLGALRLHQWTKNLLLFVPLVLGHQLHDPHAILRCIAGLLLMGATASGTYLLNDLADLAADRRHAHKRHRALASGRISVMAGLFAGLGLIAAGLAGALALGHWVALGLAGYVAVSLCYSAGLKAVPLLDTLTIGGLFTLRLALGVALARVPFSPWLMSFAAFFFFSLALSKRHCELMEARDTPGAVLARNGYRVDDWPLTLAFGAGSALAALQIMILFVADEAWPSRLYATPAWLYVAPAALAVWLARIWLLAHRQQLRHDPVVFALRDRTSWAIGGVIAAAILAAL